MKLALIGKNIQYSLSPIIHRILFNKYKIKASYELMDIDVLDKEKIYNYLNTNKYLAFNVTIPYKEFFNDICNLDSNYTNINCLFKKDSSIVSANTDYKGFLYSLEYFNILHSIKSVIIMGTGASATTIAKALALYGKNIIFVSRKNIDLYLGFKVISYSDLDKYKADILINCTPIGSQFSVENSGIIFKSIDNFKYFYSLSYLSSFFFANSRVKSYNGLVMLVAQAAIAQSYFFDRKLDLNEDVLYVLNILENNNEINDYKWS